MQERLLCDPCATAQLVLCDDEGLAEGAASDERQKESALSKSSAPSDGIEGLFDGCELRFGRDKRLEEVHQSCCHQWF